VKWSGQNRVLGETIAFDEKFHFGRKEKNMLIITGGDLKGRRIQRSKEKHVRPSSSRLREALFSIISSDLLEASFLDGFGGSGVMGLEAHSRGASQVCIVEKSNRIYRQIQRTVNDLPVEVELVCADLRAVVKRRQFDIIFMDPPYKESPDKWLEVAQHAAGSILIIEHHLNNEPKGIVGEWHRDHVRNYGSCALSIYRRSNDGR